MQYYRDGYHPGDPAIAPAAECPAAATPDAATDVDVLIVGTGPAGLVLAAQLARHPRIRTRIVERREGPLTLGRADGVACRSVEMFQAFGFAHTLLEEAYWVNETTFWRPDPDRSGTIMRTSRTRDVEDGLSEMPHLIMNQARIHDHLLEAAHSAPTRLTPDYGTALTGLERTDHPTHPVTVSLEDTATGEASTVRARFVVGCDGARSPVRSAIGRSLSGDRANHAWGVMDILLDTDFPDIRFKSAIQSETGSILLIPREGGYLVRLYVDLGTVTDDDRAEIRSMSADDVVQVARRVLAPYSLEVKETVWFSVYEVAQRIADGFDDVVGRAQATDGEASLPRIFIAGDACHTHSAKAGQGMNVSMQDAFNLGWKLAAVLEGRSDHALLHTYDAERRPVAQELIDFDKEWSAMMAAAPADPAHPERGGVTAAELSDYFVQHGRYTAGVATSYAPGSTHLTDRDDHQHLAPGLPVGYRFHSAPVQRAADAKEMQLGHAATADGRWRLYAFADAEQRRFDEFVAWLDEDPGSPVNRHRLPGEDPDARIDVRAVLQAPHTEIVLADLPEVLRPSTGALGLTDLEKVFSSRTHSGADVFAQRGIDAESGAVVIVRPDQYVAAVLPLDAAADVAAFFDGVFDADLRAPLPAP